MSETEWARALLFASYVQGLHNLGLLRAIAIYFRHEADISYDDFYNKLIDYSQKNENSMLGRIYSRINGLCEGIISGSNGLVSTCEGLGEMWWGFDELVFLEFYKNLEAFYEEVKTFALSELSESEAVDALFDYQYSIIKKIGAGHITIKNNYDFFSYYNNIYSGGYEKLSKKEISITVDDHCPVTTFADFAREVVWYGRNRRATDYTSTNYQVNIC